MQAKNFDLHRLSQKSQWLALSVTAHKLSSIGQIDGYTILLQSNSQRSQLLGPDEDVVAVPPWKDLNGKSAEDAEMSDSITGLPSESQSQASLPLKTGQTTELAGFQSYLCAEYIDSMTGQEGLSR